MSEIRPCSREDIPAVAALFQRTFRNSETDPPQSLADCLDEVHFGHPWFDPEISPRVHVNAEGRVTGFVGIFPGRFEYRGRPVRAAIAGSLMVEHPEREPLAGAKLMRSVIGGPQDISISETTNPVSQGLWQRLGGRVVPLFSLDWFRVLRPGRAALSLVSELMPRASMLAPAAGAADWIGGRWTKRYLAPKAPVAPLKSDLAALDMEFAAAILDLADSTDFRPRWSEGDLRWFLDQAAAKARYGALHRAIVRDGKDNLAGCYLYHGKPGGIGRVLNVLARPDAMEGVVDCLFHEAGEAGLAALRGRSTPQLVNALLTRQCIFAHRGSTIVHTRDEELGHAIESGRALITGLAGESWSRLVGHDFR